jgi:hypothetical protein
LRLIEGPRYFFTSRSVKEWPSETACIRQVPADRLSSVEAVSPASIKLPPAVFLCGDAIYEKLNKIIFFKRNSMKFNIEDYISFFIAIKFYNIHPQKISQLCNKK